MGEIWVDRVVGWEFKLMQHYSSNSKLWSNKPVPPFKEFMIILSVLPKLILPHGAKNFAVSH